jgi:hypothetical protein
MLIPAHRYVLQLVIYRWVTVWMQLGAAVAFIVAGAIVGTSVAVFGTLIIAGILEWVMHFVFPTGL